MRMPAQRSAPAASPMQACAPPLQSRAKLALLRQEQPTAWVPIQRRLRASCGRVHGAHQLLRRRRQLRPRTAQACRHPEQTPRSGRLVQLYILPAPLCTARLLPQARPAPLAASLTAEQAAARQPAAQSLPRRQAEGGQRGAWALAGSLARAGWARPAAGRPGQESEELRRRSGLTRSRTR